MAVNTYIFVWKKTDSKPIRVSLWRPSGTNHSFGTTVVHVITEGPMQCLK